MSQALTQAPTTDPTQAYRYRDGLYAQDMLVAGLVWLDLFSWLGRNPSDQAAIQKQFATTERPTDVMLTLFVAMGFLEKRNQIYEVTPTAREHLCADSPWFLGPYYASLKDRPVCKDLLAVLRSGKPGGCNVALHVLSFASRRVAMAEFCARRFFVSPSGCVTLKR